MVTHVVREIKRNSFSLFSSSLRCLEGLCWVCLDDEFQFSEAFVYIGTETEACSVFLLLVLGQQVVCESVQGCAS